MAITYSSISTWSRVCAALRVFVVSVATVVVDFARYVAHNVAGWVRRAAGRTYLALAERLPLAGLNARESFHLRAAKRGRPTVMPRWRMCASV
ncbi:hypothetical protein [Cupriavidus sp. UBA2534]|uniref:hypothetical protein n=1 Tax=Cupriavidus sp. UBA2534 TaxID=1946399 RepID=UPI00257F50AB|nr:hypothetical protein [Cupriavidus sp. UBA2534]